MTATMVSLVNDLGLDEADDGLETAPHNEEAEQALLGTILYDNEVFNRLGDFLKPDHFYNPVHGRIFKSMQTLIQRGALADAVVLKNRFEQDETLADIGGAEYLAFLLHNAPSGTAAPEYARLIFDLYLRRKLIGLGDEIRKKAVDGALDEDALEQIEAAERMLFSLAETGGTSGGFTSFENAIAESIDNAAAAYQREGKLSGISTGFRDLDDKLGGLHPSDLIILAGRPSMGKTALATNIAFNVANAFNQEPDEDGNLKTVSGGVVGFFSLEMSSDQLATRILAGEARISSHKLRTGDISATEFAELRDAAAVIREKPLYIDDTGGITLGALTARARRLKRTVGLDCLIIDYLQLITAGSGRMSENRVQEITAITVGLKALAKELDIPIIALAQLSRQVEQRDDKRPQLADLRESGSIEQDADVVMFVFRKSYYLSREEPDIGSDNYQTWQDKMQEHHGKAEVIIGKQRHGPIGAVPMSFEESLTKFGDLDQIGRYEDSIH